MSNCRDTLGIRRGIAKGKRCVPHRRVRLLSPRELCRGSKQSTMQITVNSINEHSHAAQGEPLGRGTRHIIFCFALYLFSQRKYSEESNKEQKFWRGQPFGCLCRVTLLPLGVFDSARRR